MNLNTLANVIGEDLSRSFELDMTNILVQPSTELNDRVEVETWISIDNDFVINETSALVASPFADFNSSIACSRVKPPFVICLIESSGKGAGVELAVVDTSIRV
ncbi:unnamed protein product [Rotaria socialis]|uniref:Uncharacterized protein n=1 Tax=Rotaria socialis TaxID=392032 RepID=A0A821TZ45_9BILA|nr:unnamed protein product [Rotaria socialis]